MILHGSSRKKIGWAGLHFIDTDTDKINKKKTRVSYSIFQVSIYRRNDNQVFSPQNNLLKFILIVLENLTLTFYTRRNYTV